jgi:putative PIN family toxin of toxin-antitoxin system
VKVVLDTNVLLAAFATRGLCEAVVAVCFQEHELVLSRPILAEFRQHLRGKFRMPQVQVKEIVALVREKATLVVPLDVPPKACRDADDLVILGTLAAGADCLVTGDNDLLALGQYDGRPIYSPRAFYDRLRAQG